MGLAPTPSSNLAQLPLYGRKYLLLVKFPPDAAGNQTVLKISDSSFEPEALRVTFDVYTPAWQNFWYADISIYNLDESKTLQLLGNNTQGPTGIKEGMEVILYAGYLNGNYGVIWDGFVMQPLWDRENVTDFKVTLHCVIGLPDLTRNFINNTYGGSVAGVSQLDLLSKMAKDCFRPIGIQPGAISGTVNNTPLPRGKTVFGNPKRYFNWVAADNNMMAWLDAKGLKMADLGNVNDISKDDVVVYTPQTGIIGTPVQTQYGADFRFLLDPRIQAKKPLMQIKVDNTIIRQQKKEVGVPPGLLDQDGQYIVQAVRHVGDTRGQEWYTEVIGITSLNGKAALIQAIGTDISWGRM